MRRILLLPVLLVVALNGAVVGGAVLLRTREAHLERSHAAKAAVYSIVAELSQAEAGLGVFAATGDVAVLESFDRTRDVLPARIGHLEEAVSEPADAEGLLKDFLAATTAHMRALRDVRDHLLADGTMSGELVAATRDARSQVRAVTAQLIFREDELLGERRSSVRVVRIWLIAAAATAALAGLVCGATAMIVLSGRSSSGSARRGRPATEPSIRVAPPVMEGRSGPVSVLVVDDERHIREVLQRWLKPLGFEVRQAADAQAALDAIAQQAPDVLVCDIHMPGRDGLWLAARVREHAPTCGIVLATGDDTVPPFESFRQGVVGYVLKPFRREQLLAAVQEGIRWSAQAGGTFRGRSREPLDMDALS